MRYCWSDSSLYQFKCIYIVYLLTSCAAIVGLHQCW